jgi:hypothetical protein
MEKQEAEKLVKESKCNGCRGFCMCEALDDFDNCGFFELKIIQRLREADCDGRTKEQGKSS